MMNTEQAKREAERRFRDYEAEAMCTCGVYRIALRPRVATRSPGEPMPRFDLTDTRLYSSGSSYEGALAAANPPPITALRRLPDNC
ncbi:MAG TPA: hypothetical protein VER11_19330 [Polyangiaceae bacterium]|nr:hypothetical protein [Polyangiaceae bacterium]